MLPAARAACRLLEELATRIAEDAAKRAATEQQRREQEAQALAVAEEEGLKEMKETSAADGVMRFPMMMMGGGKEVNGIPEGQMWTVGFMPGGGPSSNDGSVFVEAGNGDGGGGGSVGAEEQGPGLDENLALGVGEFFAFLEGAV